MPAANNNQKSDGKSTHQQEPDNNDQEPGLLPPQALLSTPPPPLSDTEDTSTLLSPWWSEEPPAEPTSEAETEPTDSTFSISTSSLENNINHDNSNDYNSSSSSSNSSSDSNSNSEDSPKLNISILSFGRSAPKESSIQWKERCVMLATTTQLNKTTQDNNNVQKELEEIFDKSKECSMICFLRTSREMTKKPAFTLNPFYGTWITVAKTPMHCKQHLLDAGNIEKKSLPEYYTMELGEELSHSGEYVTKTVTKTFSPLQHLTQRYINSWKDGTQQAFFSKFWSSIQKGDAFFLVRDRTKKLFEDTLGHDKKPSDKK